MQQVNNGPWPDAAAAASSPAPKALSSPLNNVETTLCAVFSTTIVFCHGSWGKASFTHSMIYCRAEPSSASGSAQNPQKGSVQGASQIAPVFFNCVVDAVITKYPDNSSDLLTPVPVNPQRAVLLSIEGLLATLV